MDNLLFKADRRGYPVTFFPSLEKLAKHLRTIEPAYFITNATVYKLYEQWFGNLAPIITVPDSETAKNLKEFEAVVTQLVLHGADRSSAIVAIGGGVVGDLSGFVAATYMRGLPIIHVPTTLLAMVDSSMGGKVGINHELGKNQIGAIWPPHQVCICSDFLRTLPAREFVSGMAEVIKYGLIADEHLFEWCEQSVDALMMRDPRFIDYAIKQSCRTKKTIVESDEYETGLRMILNLGHTLAHALENLSHYRLLSHGEAVYFGIVFAAVLSHHVGTLASEEVDRITAVIQHLASAYLGQEEVQRFVQTIPFDLLWSAMERDKKAAAGKIRFALLERIGKAYIASITDMDAIQSAFEDTRERFAR